MGKLRSLSQYPGVYYRVSSKKRLPSGEFDTCFEVFYHDANKNFRYEKIGWVSEGKSLEMAAERSVILIAEEKLMGPSKRTSSPRQAKKIKTKYPGVYTKVSFRKLDSNGKPDRCYDIVWYIGDGKYRWEKIGWASEGYTELDAVRIRAERVSTFQDTGISPRTNMLTLNESWQIYCKNWLPNLRETKNFTARYNNYLGPKFGDRKLADIKTHHIEEYKHFLV